MAQFDRSNTTYYWSVIVSKAFFSYLMLNNIATLKSGLMVTRGH